IRPGDYFRVDLAIIPGGVARAQLVRCIGRSFGPTGPITLDWETEPGSAPVPVVVPWGDLPPEEPVALPPLDPVRLIALPPAAGEAPTISVLANRSDDVLTGFDVLYDDSASVGTFPTIGDQPGFALPVTLA